MGEVKVGDEVLRDGFQCAGIDKVKEGDKELR